MWLEWCKLNENGSYTQGLKLEKGRLNEFNWNRNEYQTERNEIFSLEGA